MNCNKLKAWDEYSDDFVENDNGEESQLLIDSKIDLFLRKYTSFPLNKEELIDIFIQYDFDEKKINLILDGKLKESVEKLLKNNIEKENEGIKESQKINKIEDINLQCEKEQNQIKRNKSYKDSKTKPVHESYIKEIEQHRNKSFQPNKVNLSQKEIDINSKCSTNDNETKINPIKNIDNINIIKETIDDFMSNNDELYSTNDDTINDDMLLDLKKFNSTGLVNNRHYIEKKKLTEKIDPFEIGAQLCPGRFISINNFAYDNKNFSKNNNYSYKKTNEGYKIKTGLELAYDYYFPFLVKKNH